MGHMPVLMALMVLVPTTDLMLTDIMAQSPLPRCLCHPSCHQSIRSQTFICYWVSFIGFKFLHKMQRSLIQSNILMGPYLVKSQVRKDSKAFLVDAHRIFSSPAIIMLNQFVSQCYSEFCSFQYIHLNM